MSVPRPNWDPWGRAHVDPRESGKKAFEEAEPMHRESGAKFKCSGGWEWDKDPALRFLGGNVSRSWCDTEQKQAITICKEVLSGRS